MSDLKVKWPKIVNSYFFPQCHWIDLGNGTMFRIGAFYTTPNFGGPREGLFVSIEDKGSFLFAIDFAISFQYVSERLNLMEPDARNIADWINAQLEHDVNQQGIYYKSYIDGVEPYGHIGESLHWPLKPEIIEGDNDEI